MLEMVAVLMMFGAGWYLHRYRAQQMVACKNAEIRRLRLELSESADTAVFSGWNHEIASIRRGLKSS